MCMSVLYISVHGQQLSWCDINVLKSGDMEKIVLPKIKMTKTSMAYYGWMCSDPQNAGNVFFFNVGHMNHVISQNVKVMLFQQHHLVSLCN